MSYSDYDSDGYQSHEDEDYVPSDDNLSEDDMNECEKEDPLHEDDSVPHPGKKKKKRKDAPMRKRRKSEDEGREGADRPRGGDEDEATQKKKSDDLWASFLSDVGTRPKAPTGECPSGKPETSSSDLQPPASTAETKTSQSDKVVITKVFDFAGEEVRVSKEVSADSREARTYLKSQKAEQDDAENPDKPPVSDSPSPGASTKRPPGMSSILSRIGGKKPKMSTLEKSKMDWDAFKSEEGITEELAIHNRGKEGFVERKNFLERVDHRQFELEKANVLAKALYDNVAESPDELSFRKGDIMTVLERDTQGLDGWWLCSLHGRQGIVPGNRLKILVGMYDSKQQASPSTPDPTSQVLRPLPTKSAYPKPSLKPPGSSVGFPTKTLPGVQYTSMHPAYSTPSPAQSSPDSVYMMPPSHGPKPSSQGVYQVPSGPSGPPLQAQPAPPSKTTAVGHRQFQTPGQDIYQVPPSVGPGPGQGTAPPAGGQDVYQVPPSLEKRNWESSNKPLGKVVVPTRVGQMYVYDTVKPEQDEYDIPPRHPPPTQQDIYDVPPARQQYNTQVYDTPPMVMKGPSSCQDIYDTPPGPDKNPQQTVYDFPPSVSKDAPDGHLIREETYDVPPHFAKLKPKAPVQYPHNVSDDDEPPIPEDVYDVPPPILTDKHLHRDRAAASQPPQDIYDIPSALRSGSHTIQDVYDFPREREERGGERGDQYIYDVPPQVVRDPQSSGDDQSVSFKRLSASSTGSTRSNHSSSSLDVVPVRDSSAPGKPLILDLDQAMERLSRLQQAVESSVSLMMSFITGNWRSSAHLEGNLPAIHQAADRVRITVRDFLEFARGAVANSAQATDRSLQTKLSRQVGKMEEVFQSLVRHSQSLDAIFWSHAALSTPPPGGDDLDRLIMTARGIPDDAKQLASFLHGNASLLFKRTNRQQQQLPLPPIPGEISSHMTGSGSGSYQGGEKVHIQSRPLPSPPKFTSAEEEAGVERPYESTEEGWMEDYDYVHLQGKEEFEKNQRQLLEKDNIIRNNKSHLEQQQIKKFEQLEQEVCQPINNDMTGWVPPPHHSLANSLAKSSAGDSSSSKLCHGDRQLLLFYQEQCEHNITTVTNAIDAFFTAVNSNQPPKIFVAHSKFVILSAHKLVFIGDTLSRQARCPEVRSRVAQSSNTLCEKLKDIVISTKTAALQYPAPGAARDMTERVRELAGCTQHFRMVLGQLLLM